MCNVVDSSLNSRLQNSLRTAEGRLLDAISRGETHFHRTWSCLQKDIAAAKETSSLTEDTLHLAHVVAASVSVLAQSFLDVEAKTCAIESTVISEMQEVVDSDLLVYGRIQGQDEISTTHAWPQLQPSRLSKPSLQSLRHPTTPITSALTPILPSAAASITESTCSASDPNPLPEFIEHAYKFFVANIFNPYPTRAEKESIVAQTNNERVTFSSISNWFANARRRCGWTTILKERFEGNREQLVAIATRVFINPDPKDPVDPKIVQELMEMKEAVETMYERKACTSAWMEGLDNLEDLLPLSGSSPENQHEMAEDRRRAREAQKKEREFERGKRKMQAEALRKAEKVTKMMQREQAKQKKKVLRAASYVVPEPPQPFSDEDSVTEPLPVAGGKRKLVIEDEDVYRFPDLRQMSRVSSRSSSFISDGSSEGRVPSLTWSESGDERPYKRSRSTLVTPPSSSYSNSPRLSPEFGISANVDHRFTLEPSQSLTTDPSTLETLFDFSVAPCDMLVGRGKKRPHDQAEEIADLAPQPKRRRSSQPVIASVGPDLMLLPPPSSPPSTPPAPSTPLFTPRASFDATPTQAPRKRSLELPSLDAILGLDLTQPPQVQIVPPDPSLPLDVGVFNWSLDDFGDAGVGDAPADFSQLLQLLGGDGNQAADEMPPFDLTSPAFLPHGQHQHGELHPTLAEDLSGLMSGLMSDEALHDMGMDLAASLAVTPDLSRESSVAPAMPHDALAVPTPAAPLSLTTPAELDDKALKRECRRKELAEKRAALERERERIAELERELEDD